VLISDDRGQTWQQRPAPVSADLVAVHFPSDKQGWAVGHDGVVLSSADGGLAWSRAMDGRTLGASLATAYEKRAAKGEAEASRLLEEARQMERDGPTRPFLSVYFRSDHEGWLAGQFNLLLHTADGGQSWEPWLERTENPDALSLHAMREAGGSVFIVGELGLVLRLDSATQKFRRMETPFKGSWFGLTGDARCVVAFGLRGVAASSCDGGQAWKAVDTGTVAAIVGILAHKALVARPRLDERAIDAEVFSGYFSSLLGFFPIPIATSMGNIPEHYSFFQTRQEIWHT